MLASSKTSSQKKSLVRSGQDTVLAYELLLLAALSLLLGAAKLLVGMQVVVYIF